MRAHNIGSNWLKRPNAHPYNNNVKEYHFIYVIYTYMYICNMRTATEKLNGLFISIETRIVSGAANMNARKKYECKYM